MCCDWTEGLFSSESFGLSMRERDREELYSVGSGHWALCQLLLWALIKKKNLYPASGHGSVGLTGASPWNLPTQAGMAHSKRQQKGRHSAGLQQLSRGACHLPANCQVVPNLYVPPSESQSNSTDKNQRRGTMVDGLEVWAKGHCLHNGWPLKRCLAWLINQSHHSTIRWPGTRTQKTKQGLLIAPGAPFLQRWLSPFSRRGPRKQNRTGPSQVIRHCSALNKALQQVPA